MKPLLCSILAFSALLCFAWPVPAFAVEAGFPPAQIPAIAHTDTKTTNHFLLERGRHLAAEGLIDSALAVWESAVTTPDIPLLELAVAHLELTTAQEKDTRYTASSSLYLWALSRSDAEWLRANAGELALEIDRLEPIVGAGYARQWRQLLREQPEELPAHLLAFWEEVDRTPGTRHNERLIEHWRRIAYAREHFTRVKHPPYDTDARGIAWVQYGKPDRMFTETIFTSAAEIENKVGRFIQGPRARSYALTIEQMIPDPTVELWTYFRPNDKVAYNVNLMFGVKAVGGYGRLTTLEELIPNSLFTLTNRFDYQNITNTGGGNFSPAMLMQFISYGSFATKDEYFGNVYSYLNSIWDPIIPDMRKERFYGNVLKNERYSETIQNLRAAPQEISTEEKDFPAIPLRAVPYRLFSATGQPVLVTYLESFPSGPFLTDIVTNQDVLFSSANPDTTALQDYSLIHGLILRTGKSGTQRHLREYATLIVDPERSTPSATVFEAPWLGKDIPQVFYAELHNNNERTRQTRESLFPDNLRGIGRLNLSQPAHIEGEGMLVSDLVPGWDVRERPGVRFPFVVATTGEIPKGENLAVFFQVKDATAGTDGVRRFSLRWKIEPRGGLLGLGKGGKKSVEVISEFRTDKAVFEETLELSVSEPLLPGKYRLQWVVTDLATGTERRQHLDFQVSE